MSFMSHLGGSDIENSSHHKGFVQLWHTDRLRGSFLWVSLKYFPSQILAIHLVMHHSAYLLSIQPFFEQSSSDTFTIFHGKHNERLSYTSPRSQF